MEFSEFWKSFSCFSLSGMAIKFLVEDEADVVMSMFSQHQPILKLVNGPPGPMFHLVAMCKYICMCVLHAYHSISEERFCAKMELPPINAQETNTTHSGQKYFH